MTTEEIQNLGLVLGPEIPYFAQGIDSEPRKEPIRLAERLQIMLADYELFWNLPRTFAAAGLPLPELAWPPAVRPAYQFCLDPNYRDENLTTAYELQQPQCQRDRDIIRAASLCPDGTNAKIGEPLGLLPGVIDDFQTLWWHVRDRRDDLLFRAQLAQGPHSRFARKLMRWASRTGKTAFVMLAAGVPNLNQKITDSELREELEYLLAIDALIGQEIDRFTKKDNPALAAVERYLLAPAETPAEWDDLMALSFNKEAQRKLKQGLQEEAEETRAAERALLKNPAGDKLNPVFADLQTEIEQRAQKEDIGP
jgi:hypothetical protein